MLLSVSVIGRLEKGFKNDGLGSRQVRVPLLAYNVSTSSYAMSLLSVVATGKDGGSIFQIGTNTHQVFLRHRHTKRKAILRAGGFRG